MKKITKITACLMMFFITAVSLVACGGGIEAIVIKEGTVPTTIVQNSTFDPSNYVIVVKNSDGSTQEISVQDEEVELSIFDTSVLGVQTLFITYKEMRVAVDIEVVQDPATIVSAIKVKEGTVATTVMQNDHLVTGYMMIVVTYQDGHTAELHVSADGVVIDAFDTTTAGNKMLTVRYQGKVVNFPIEVISNSEEESVLNSISVKAGTAPTTVYQNAELDLSGLLIVATYSNKTDEFGINTEGVSTSTFNTAVLGVQTLTITFGEKSTSVNIEVVVDPATQTPEIMGVEMPGFVNTFKNNQINKLDDPTTDKIDESENTFKILNKSYKVGDENAFIFRPICTDEEGEPVTDFATVTTIEIQTAPETFSVLTGEDLATYVDSINEQTSGVDFSALAVGKTFKITTRPSTLEEDSISLVVEVVSGYNIHNVKQLSAIDNITNLQDIKASGAKGELMQGIINGWASIKSENNVGTAIKGAVLHNDLIVTTNDIPSAFILADGTLMDWISIYSRKITEDDSFTMYGNYFCIDASTIPAVKVEDSRCKHSTLFGFGGDNDNSFKVADTGVGTINDLKIVANAQKSEENTNKQAGGLVMLMTCAQETNLNNIIFRCAQTQIIGLHNTTLHDENDSGDYNNQLNINNSKIFDTYSTALYLWALKNTEIHDSILKRAGGPLMMAVHVDSSNPANADHYSDVRIYGDSVLESYIEGTEGWFATYQCTSLVGQLKAMNQLFELTSAGVSATMPGFVGKEFVNDNGKINLIGIVMDDDPLQTSNAVKGSISYIDSEGHATHICNPSEPSYAGICGAGGDVAMQGMLKQLPFFQSSAQSIMAIPQPYVTITVDGSLKPTGFGKITTELVDWVSNSTPEEIGAFLSNSIAGDRVNVYLNSGALGVVVSYYPFNGVTGA